MIKRARIVSLGGYLTSSRISTLSQHSAGIADRLLEEVCFGFFSTASFCRIAEDRLSPEKLGLVPWKVKGETGKVEPKLPSVIMVTSRQ